MCYFSLRIVELKLEDEVQLEGKRKIEEEGYNHDETTNPFLATFSFPSFLFTLYFFLFSLSFLIIH